MYLKVKLMKEKTKNKIQTATECISAGSNIAALANPWFATVPLIVFCVNRTVGLVSDGDIIKRLRKIESKLIKKKISKEQFIKKISKLTEHKKFFASTTLEYIIKNCIPETVEIYISLFIDYIMADKYDLEEELCEILSSLNKHDFELLKYIKKFLKNGEKYTYHDEYEKNQYEKEKYANLGVEKDNAKYKKIHFQDRSVILGEDKTIFWNDFANYCKLPIEISLNNTMLFESYKDKSRSILSNWNFYGKSFIKLERCGILCLDYNTYLGTMNNMEISRFHLTILGLGLLKYINVIDD